MNTSVVSSGSFRIPVSFYSSVGNADSGQIARIWKFLMPAQESCCAFKDFLWGKKSFVDSLEMVLKLAP